MKKLKKCICGKKPSQLEIKEGRKGSRWMQVQGKNCCNRWWLEIDNKYYYQPGSIHITKLAEEAWNQESDRLFNKHKTNSKKQSKIKSFIEANINTAVGFILSTLVWHYIVPILFPYMAPHTGWSTAIWITVLFTFVSITRNYVIRRLFNKL